MKTMKLIVKDALKDDAGRGVARVDPDIISELTLKRGDVVEITYPTTNLKTAALLYPGKKKDKGTGIIRIDQHLRRNLNASLDDIIEIRKIDAALAEKITLAGLKEAIVIKNTQQLAKKLENRVITKNDILSFYAYGRRVDLVVVDFSPKSEAIRIHLDTKIIFSKKSYRDLIELEE